MQKHKLKLYHYWRSSCSWRVRWALHLKQLEYTSVPVNLLEQEQLSETFGEKSPAHFVPCLEIDGKPFSESIAIIEWLEQEYSEPSLLPGNSFDKMKIRQLAFIIASGTQPVQNLCVQKYHSSDPAERKKFAQHWINRGLQAYEKSIAYTAQKYSYGETVTLADLCLVPQCYNAERFEVDLNQFPRINSIYHTCLKTSACDLAAPHNQPK